MDISEEKRGRLEQPEVGSGAVSVSLSCPEFSVKDGNDRAGRDSEERSAEDLMFETSEGLSHCSVTEK